jgi:hypothetical protein
MCFRSQFYADDATVVLDASAAAVAVQRLQFIFQGDCEFPNSAPDFFGVYGGESQLQTLAHCRALTIATQRSYLYTSRGCRGRNRFSIQASLQPARRLQTRFYA